MAEAAQGADALVQAARADLFGEFGQNFAQVGSNPFATELGQAAGMRFFGAVPQGEGGVLAVAGGGGRVIQGDVIINQEFPVEADSVTWARGIDCELGALCCSTAAV
jgi:hypothetical protein